ncbi:coenzyme A pyrophosphatase, partial [Clostridium botulinum]|nr:coenzyme A pyrophosphatase [Clostridium botulinum]
MNINKITNRIENLSPYINGWE